MPSEELGEMFEGDSADMCAEKFPLMSMVARAENQVCTDPGARTPIGVSEIVKIFYMLNSLHSMYIIPSILLFMLI